MNIPCIVIIGDGGKSITIKYIEYILRNFNKNKTLIFDISETGYIENITINFYEKIDVNPYRLGAELLNLENEQKEIKILETIAEENGVNVIICKNSRLTPYLNVKLSVFTFVDTMSNLSNIFSHQVLREKNPLVFNACKLNLFKSIHDICFAGKIPVFISTFHHLKYIEIDTKINSKYSFMNLGLALTACEIFHKLIEQEMPLFKFKSSTVNNLYKIYTCGYYSKYNLKQLEFPEYCKLYSNKNLRLYVEPGGNFKGTNLLSWNFLTVQKNYSDLNKNVFILIYYNKPNSNIIKNFLPLSNLHFNHIFIIDRNDVGKNFEQILEEFKLENSENSENLKNSENYKNFLWTETIHEAISFIYNESDMEKSRKLAFYPLAEYYTPKEEMENVYFSTLLPKMPIITVDELTHIYKWIEKLTSTYNNAVYHILCTGCKSVVNETMKAFGV